MPIYSYICHAGHAFERYLPLDEYSAPQMCECGKASDKRITAPMIRVEKIEYESPIDGRPIMTKQARIEDLARNNCVEYDPGMKDDYQRRQKAEADALDRSIDETVESEIYRMPTRKRELLESELRAGADMACTRSTYQGA